MTSTRLTLVGLILITGILGAFGGNAVAYVLEAPHVLYMMVDSIGAAPSLRVMQRMYMYPDGPDAEALEMKQTLWYRSPFEFRSETELEGRQKIYVYNAGSQLFVLDGEIIAGTENAADHYKDILLFRDHNQLMNGLIALGVDVTICSLGRFNDRIGYVVGAMYPDTSVPQLWVDQKTFRPFRLLVREQTISVQTGILDIRYLGWRQDGKTWYPGEIEINRNNIVLQTFEVDALQADAEIADGLFDIEQLRNQFKQAEPLLEAAPADPMGEVRQSIEDFKNMYE